VPRKVAMLGMGVYPWHCSPEDAADAMMVGERIDVSRRDEVLIFFVIGLR